MSESAHDVSLALRVKPCFRLWQRMLGLLGRPFLDADEALWISPCWSVHTFGMRFDLDVVFIDRRGKVLRIVQGLSAGRFAACSGASSVIEMSAGAAGRQGIVQGDLLKMAVDPAGETVEIFLRKPPWLHSDD